MQIVKQLVNTFFFLTLLLSAIPMMLLADASFREYLGYEDFTLYKENIRSILYIIVLPAFASAASLFAVYKILRIIQRGESVLSKTHPVRTTFFSLLLCMGLFFLYGLVYDSPPNLFPFNDPDATYTISKDFENNMYVIRYTTTSDRNRSYHCSWQKNGNKNCRWEDNKDITGIAIGKSPVDLKKFLDKNLKINGSFAYADTQCIINSCKRFSRRLVVNVSSIEVVSPQK